MSDEDYPGFTPIMDEDQIKDYAESNGFMATEVTDFLAPDEAFAILGDNTPEYMADFMRSHGIESLFYEYDYLDESDAYVYPLDDDVTEGMEPAVAEAVNKVFDDWNDEVDNTDFSEPALLYLYAIYQGRVFGIDVEPGLPQVPRGRPGAHVPVRLPQQPGPPSRGGLILKLQPGHARRHFMMGDAPDAMMQSGWTALERACGRKRRMIEVKREEWWSQCDLNA